VISEVAQYVNDTKTQLANRQKMWQLHSRMQCDKLSKMNDKAWAHETRLSLTLNLMNEHTATQLFKANRVIVKEGEVKKVIRGKECPCLAVLFNDSLLLAEIVGEQSEQLLLLAIISLFEATVNSIGPVSIPTHIG